MGDAIARLLRMPCQLEVKPYNNEFDPNYKKTGVVIVTTPVFSVTTSGTCLMPGLIVGG